MYIPDELWCHILTYISSFEDAWSLSKCNKSLWYSWKYELSMQRYAPNPISRLILESSGTCRTTQYAILMSKCQLCSHTLRNTLPHPLWNIYAHRECVTNQTVSFAAASKQYDINFENVSKIPSYRSRVWKYHGGRSFLPFDVHQTLQGVCLRMHHESLYERRVRMRMLHSKVNAMNRSLEAKCESKSHTLKRVILEENRKNERNRRLRVSMATQRQHERLHEIITDVCPDLDETLVSYIKLSYRGGHRLPIAWRDLPAMLRRIYSMQVEYWDCLLPRVRVYLHSIVTRDQEWLSLLLKKPTVFFGRTKQELAKK
jgi:hypothetical protein